MAFLHLKVSADHDFSRFKFQIINAVATGGTLWHRQIYGFFLAGERGIH